MIDATNGNQQGSTAAGLPAGGRKPLWGDQKIEVIVGTGEFGVGKTTFGVLICPGPETLVCDNEGSSSNYQASVGFVHLDMAVELSKKHPKGYTDIDRYLWFRDDFFRLVQTRQYRVAMVDPFSEIEAGLCKFVEKNCTQYGLTPAQVQKSPGLFYAAVKAQLKNDLDRMRPYVETIYLVVHMRDEWKNGVRTGKREPKGKETLFELASLFLEFQPGKDAKGNPCKAPAAVVLKSRLSRMQLTEDGDMDVLPILPPRVPKATPAEIRKYIAAPPDYSKLRPEERIKEREMTDEEKLRLQATIAESQQRTAEAELARQQTVERQLEAQRAAAERMEAAKTVTPPPSDASGQRAEAVAAKAGEKAAEDAFHPPAQETEEPPFDTDPMRQTLSESSATPYAIKRIRELAEKCKFTDAQIAGVLRKDYHVERIEDLNAAQSEAVIDRLTVRARQLNVLGEEAANTR